MALLCLQHDRSLRPSIDQVLEGLNFDINTAIPTVPGFIRSVTNPNIIIKKNPNIKSTKYVLSTIQNLELTTGSGISYTGLVYVSRSRLLTFHADSIVCSLFVSFFFLSKWIAMKNWRSLAGQLWCRSLHFSSNCSSNSCQDIFEGNTAGETPLCGRRAKGAATKHQNPLSMDNVAYFVFSKECPTKTCCNSFKSLNLVLQGLEHVVFKYLNLCHEVVIRIMVPMFLCLYYKGIFWKMASLLWLINLLYSLQLALLFTSSSSGKWWFLVELLDNTHVIYL
jgi:hypothetical protein